MRWAALCMAIGFVCAYGCATTLQAPEPNGQKVYIIPKEARDKDLICLIPEKGSLFSQCMTAARFKVMATGVSAN